MFKFLGPNWVESSDGFSVRRKERTLLIYAEGEKQVDVEVEPGDGLAIYTQTIDGWKQPFEDVPLTAADRQRIVVRIVEGLRAMGVTAVVA